MICDALEGKCDHSELRYRDPLSFHPVTQRDGTIGWVFPKWRTQGADEARLVAQLRERDGREASKPTPNPSKCTECGDWLATFQVTNGFTVCSACYRRARQTA